MRPAFSALSSTFKVFTSVDITADMGVLRSILLRVTRGNTSYRVKMPRMVFSSSQTRIDPTFFSWIRVSASRRGVLGPVVSGFFKRKSPRRLSSDCSSRACEAKELRKAARDSCSKPPIRLLKKSLKGLDCSCNWRIAATGMSKQKQSSTAV